MSTKPLPNPLIAVMQMTVTKAPPRTVPQTISLTALYPGATIKIQILADGRSSKVAMKGAETYIRHPPVSTPSYEFDTRKKITRFTSDVVFNGSIEIQTVYGPNASATQMSTYGRGTTPDDIANGNTSLGFHEYCHQQDYIAYLRSHPLPVLRLTTGITEHQYKLAVSQFQLAYTNYFTSLKKNSAAKTDAVGKRR